MTEGQKSNLGSTEIGSKVLDDLDGVIHDLGPTLCYDDLLSKGMEWIEMGIDIRVLHGAVIVYLEETLDKTDYTTEVQKAWTTSFLGVLMKMSPSN